MRAARYAWLPTAAQATPSVTTRLKMNGTGVNGIRWMNGQVHVTRTVHMNLPEHPADIELSDMGHSIGRWEDGVLIIHTEKFAAGVLTGSTLHTDQMTLEERLSITQDKGRLLISWIVSDPEYYAEPLTGSQELQPTSQDIIRYECIPGAPLGYEQ